jgi:uncharacterized membrane protein YjjP (DUF1212 family)
MLAPLDREALADVVDLALWVGQLLMESGAESQRVEQTVRAVGVGLGCDWGNVLVSHNALIVTHVSGGEFRTKIRRVTVAGVNLSLIEALSHLAHRVEEGKYDRVRVRAELEGISQTPRLYNRWLTVIAVGLACAAFSRLFGGDWPAFGATWIAAALAMFVRQELTHRGFNSLLIVILTAFVAGGLVGLLHLFFQLSRHPEAALAASVLLLVPGVPFINAVEDLIKGHTVVGLARATAATLVILALALGLLLAMWLTAVSL